MSVPGSPGAVVSGAAGDSSGSAANIAASRSARKPPSKWTRTLSALLRRAMTTFELEQPPTCDHSAPTTVSQLRQRGLEIHATLVNVPGYRGQVARVARYELAASSRDVAMKMLAGAGVSRGAP